MYSAIEIIQKKANNHTLTKQEINFFIENIVNKKIPDYQISALLMAIYINGLNYNEAFYLTNAMWNNSEKIDLSWFNSLPIIDKHSTGGVGDKVTLILAPIIACFNLAIAKFSGKALGFTGGTIDKLNSIKVNTELDKKQISALLKQHHLFVASQTQNLVPADKILYALRDVTGTIANYALIASSILSKKFAILNTNVFIDVKYGSGSFCKTYSNAQHLIKYMMYIAKKMHRHLSIAITSMSQPLGRSIGNLIEVKEAIDFLSGNCDRYPDLKEVIYESVISIVKQCSQVKMNNKQIITRLNSIIKSKQALNKFYDWVKSQNGDYNLIKKNNFYHPNFSYQIRAKNAGFIQYLSTDKIGLISCKLGAGRLSKTDVIDNYAGIFLHKKNNDLVKKNDIVATLYSSSKITPELCNEFNATYKINKNKVKLSKIVKEII